MKTHTRARTGFDRAVGAARKIRSASGAALPGRCVWSAECVERDRVADAAAGYVSTGELVPFDGPQVGHLLNIHRFHLDMIAKDSTMIHRGDQMDCLLNEGWADGRKCRRFNRWLALGCRRGLSYACFASGRTVRLSICRKAR